MRFFQKKLINNEFVLVLLLFFFTILLIINSFFYSQKLISNSEESINLYSPSRTVNLYSSPWYEVFTGMKNPFNVSRYPTFAALSMLEKWRFPSYQIQLMYISMFIMTGLMSAYYLARLVFKFEIFVSITFSLFYLLNLFTLSQVWRRMLYSGMSLWAYMPLFILCWIKLVRKRNLKWLGFFIFCSLVFSNSFGHPAYTLVVWVPASIYVVIELLKVRKSVTDVWKLLGVSLLGVFLWLFAELWWIIDILKLGSSYISSNALSGSFNFDILKGLSVYYPTDEILLLRQSWWYGKDNHWFLFYSNPGIYFLSVSVLMLMILGWWRLRRHKYWLFFSTLLFVGWFVAKGSNPPFGTLFYSWLFFTMPFMGALRNSYEKFGLVFLLPYSAFFAYGVFSLTEKLGQKIKILSRFLVLFLTFVVLVWPIWSGGVFLKHEYVEIPKYYEQANEYLNTVGGERIMQLPYLKFNNAKFSWGYVGQNPYEFLFDRPSISGLVGVKGIDDYIQTAERYSANSGYLKLLGLIGVGNVVLHSDLGDEVGGEQLLWKNRMLLWKGLSLDKKFGSLEVYRVDPIFVRHRLYIADMVKKVDSLEQGFDGVITDKFSNFTYFDIGKDYGQVRKIKYKHMSNDLYEVNIYDATRPVVLVLNETFDNNWKAYINNQEASKHFIVNGLMNGWLIEKGGNFSVKVIFD